MKIKEPGYLFPITGGIITILGLILPLGFEFTSDTSNKNLDSFFWILFHNIEINDLDINLLFNLMISLISILIVSCTAWTFKINNDARKEKINKKEFEIKMFELYIIISLLTIYLILIIGNAYLIEKYEHHTSSMFLPYDMWARYYPSFGFYCLILGPIIIRFGIFYNTTDDNEKKKDVIIKTLIVLILLIRVSPILSYYSFSFLSCLTIFIVLDCGIYLFLKEDHPLDEVS